MFLLFEKILILFDVGFAIIFFSFCPYTIDGTIYVTSVLAETCIAVNVNHTTEFTRKSIG